MIVFLESQIWANLCSSCCTYRDCARDCLDCSQSQSGSHKHHITNGALFSKLNVSDSLTGIRKYFNQMVNVVCDGVTDAPIAGIQELDNKFTSLEAVLV